MKLISSVLFLFGLLIAGCDKSDTIPPPVSDCEDQAIVSADLYQNGPADEYFLQSASIDGNCLKMTVRYGGGCEEVLFQLFDADAIMESLPVQRNIRLSLEDDDHCEALITKDLSF